MRKFLTMLPLPEPKSGSIVNLSAQIEQLIQVICNNADEFDKNCPANINWIGTSFLSEITNFESTAKDSYNTLTSIFTSAYRFICEYEFSQPNDLSFELRSVKSFVDDNLLNFPDRARQQLIYAHYTMPAAIAKKLIHSPGLADAKAFNESLTKAVDLKKQWDDEIISKQNTVDNLKSSIDKLTEAFNFVGLVDGFKNIAEEKTREKHLAFASLMLLSALVLAPVATELAFVLNNVSLIENHKSTLLYSLPALAALEFIFIYFFRIVLTHFRSIKAQILQINLRMSLCQFIQSYATYSSKIKKDDPGALEKFENIVFSGILTDEEKIPSTFDGLDQFAKFIKAVKS